MKVGQYITDGDSLMDQLGKYVDLQYNKKNTTLGTRGNIVSNTDPYFILVVLLEFQDISSGACVFIVRDTEVTRDIMLLILLGISTLLFLIYYFTIRPLKFWKKQGVQQNTLLNAFVWSYFWFFKRENASIMVQRIYNEFSGSRYSGFYQFNMPTLFVRDPELIKQMLIKDFEHFTDHRIFVSEDCDPLFGKNLFALRGPQWRPMRSILSPAFTGSKMKAMFVLMRDCAENFVQHFMKQDRSLITVEMKDIFTRFCNDVIATTAFGVEVDSLANPENQFYLLGKKTTNFGRASKQLAFIGHIISPYISKLLGLTFYEKDVREFFGNLIVHTMREREEKGIVRPDMIHLLMEARKELEKNQGLEAENDGNEKILSETDKYSASLSDEDIIAQALIFFFAGFDSVSTLMCFMAHELAVNTDVQENLRLEINETTKRCKGKLAYDDLTSMKYMDMVVSETLRKWPTQIGFERVCTKPYTIEPALPEEKPVHLQKGIVIFIPTTGIQHDPELFPDPERFDPERFSDENSANIKSSTYQPFGVGPRNCIGSRFALLEIKVVFFYILSHFDIVPVEKTNVPMVLEKSMFRLAAEGGFWLGLKRIKD
ncbi:hypothetical protein JTB14_037590 [Gonioctena quinquepunctata]|nr:hypothetical protein JTB14_037590 [Gonioctena quinquepunctata]